MPPEIFLGSEKPPTTLYSACQNQGHLNSILLVFKICTLVKMNAGGIRYAILVSFAVIIMRQIMHLNIELTRLCYSFRFYLVSLQSFEIENPLEIQLRYLVVLLSLLRQKLGKRQFTEKILQIFTNHLRRSFVSCFLSQDAFQDISAMFCFRFMLF